MNIWFLEQYSLDPTGCWLRNWMVHSGTKMFPASSVINFTVISMRVPQTQLSYNNVLLYPLDTHWLFTPANYFRLLNFFIVFVFVVFFTCFSWPSYHVSGFYTLECHCLSSPITCAMKCFGVMKMSFVIKLDVYICVPRNQCFKVTWRMAVLVQLHNSLSCYIHLWMLNADAMLLL